MEKYQHKVSITCGLWDAYKDFRAKYKLVYPKLKRKDYVNICHRVNDALIDKIIKESMEFRMPYRLGTLSVKKNKVLLAVKDGVLEKHRLIPDWGKTWEMWNNDNPGLTRKEIFKIKDKKIIYNMNHHTNGYVMKWFWDKGTSYVPNHSVYYFRPTKANRLALASWINNEDRENDYPINKGYYEKDSRKVLRQLRRERKQGRVQEVGEDRD